MPPRLLIDSGDEIIVPAYVVTDENDPAFIEWKREHPDWFVAGTWTSPPRRRRAEPGLIGDRFNHAPANAPPRFGTMPDIDLQAAARPIPLPDPSTISLADFKAVAAEARKAVQPQRSSIESRRALPDGVSQREADLSAPTTADIPPGAASLDRAASAGLEPRPSGRTQAGPDASGIERRQSASPTAVADLRRKTVLPQPSVEETVSKVDPTLLHSSTKNHTDQIPTSIPQTVDGSGGTTHVDIATAALGLSPLYCETPDGKIVP